MDWIPVAIIGGIVAGFVLLKQAGQISAAAAGEHLKRGAKVIDVRSPEEFRSRHIPGALNVPLGDLQTQMPREAPDKTQVLLLHCLSGTRSALAKRTLKGMGYAQVFNLGSYARAERIVRDSK